MRPARPWAPLVLSVLVVFFWWLVAHNSGSGWVQFLGDAVFGTLAVGTLGPPIALSRVHIKLVSTPRDGTAGLPLSLQLETSTRIRVRPIEPPGPPTLIGPTGRRRRQDDEVTLLPPRRGVHSNIVLEIASAAPFGLQWWCRRATLPLADPLHVSPRSGEPLPLPELDLGYPGDRSRSLPVQFGDARGARPYQPGDPRRGVHWPSTAHAGRLMVREMEEPSAHPVTLRVSLPHTENAAERAAERALGTAISVLDQGTPLVMATDEPQGGFIGPVTDRREAGRRLARAVAGDGLTRIEASR